VLIVIIEKTDEGYVARSPNLLGVSVKGETRDEAESLMLDAIEKRLNGLSEAHAGKRLTVVRGALEESVPCVFRTAQGTSWEEQCKQTARKNGLCWQHWKKLYGHIFNHRHAIWVCELCGENNQYKLDKWDSPCPFKV
jgi:predicted RNase H-like HicB family nuclease